MLLVSHIPNAFYLDYQGFSELTIYGEPNAGWPRRKLSDKNRA